MTTWHIRPQGLTPYLDLLKRWLETVDGTSAYAIGNLINTLINKDKPIAYHLVASVGPASIAAPLAQARCPECYGWGSFLRRLWAAADDQWRSRFNESLPRDHLLVLATRFATTEIGNLSRLLSGLALFDFEFATECLRRALPTLDEAFRENPLEALAAVRDIRSELLGHSVFESWKPATTPAERLLSKQLTAGVRPATVATGIVTCRYGDWEAYAELLYWLGEANPAKHRRIVNTVDWKQLDIRAQGVWKRPRRELRLYRSAR